MGKLTRKEIADLLRASAKEVEDSERLAGVPSDASLWHLADALVEVFTEIGFHPDEIPDAVRLIAKAPEAK